MRSDEDLDDFLYKKDRCRDRLNSVTPKEGASDRRYEDITLQYLPPEYDRIRQTHFEREDCSLTDIRRMMSKVYAANLARSNSDSSVRIAGRGVACRRRGGTSAKQIVTSATSSAIIRTTAPTSRPPITRIVGADNDITSSEAYIRRISRSRADSSSRGG